ncbi:AAA family ATPase [Roseateles paludis]|uniref:AAA family ATPase n=1 Tax=Roseateles paludis TaxID=3145238 RepID=A0ABV0FY97_9BURK
MRATQRERVMQQLAALRHRCGLSALSENSPNALLLEMLATHAQPPESLAPFCSEFRAALSARLDDKRRAKHLRAAAGMLPRCGDALAWPTEAKLTLLEFAASLDARPKDRLDLVMFGLEALHAQTGIDVVVPRHGPPGLAGGTSAAEFNAMVDRQIQALCFRAVREVCARRPFIGWSMEDLNAALFAIRYLYANMTRTVLGEFAIPKPRQEDFRTVGQPLWDALRDAATSLKLRQPDARLLGDEDWHQRAQAAVYLSIRSPRTEVAQELALSASPVQGPSRVVCRRPIAPSSDRFDKEEVERHRILEHPLPLALMPQRLALDDARYRLCQEFPWAQDVLDIVFDDLLGRSAMGALTLSMPPTLLVGAAGSGKSRLARRIAEQLKLPRLDLCLAGSSDTKMLGGTSRGWGSSKPGDLATLMATQRTASALVLLDELDKAQDNLRQGLGLQAYLLGLLEPETASRHTDVFLKTECDYSGVLWLATANSLRDIAPTLLTRFRVLMLRQPGREHLEVIAQNVIADVANRWGVEREALPEPSELRLPLDHLQSARQVRAATEAAVTEWARQIQRH